MSNEEIENAFKENNVEAINARFNKLLRMKKNKNTKTTKLVAKKPKE